MVANDADGPDVDHDRFGASWPKHAQISPTEWMYFMGNSTGQRQGKDQVWKLDTKTDQLTKMKDSPVKVFAHQVIFMPVTVTAPKGSVYLFGGKTDMHSFSRKSYKYDIATDSWNGLPDIPSDVFSFNLLPLVNNRYILIVSDAMKLMFDTKRETWITI